MVVVVVVAVKGGLLALAGKEPHLREEGVLGTWAAEGGTLRLGTAKCVWLFIQRAGEDRRCVLVSLIKNGIIQFCIFSGSICTCRCRKQAETNEEKKRQEYRYTK